MGGLFSALFRPAFLYVLMCIYIEDLSGFFALSETQSFFYDFMVISIFLVIPTQALNLN